MYHILIVGGDKRNAILANILNREFFKVSVCGFENYAEFSDDVVFADNPAKAAQDADVIVFGLPVTKDGVNVYCPLGKADIPLSIFSENAKKDAVIAGGRTCGISDSKLKSRIVDIAKRDDFAYLNSVPTAEGAINAVMNKSAKTIHGSLCMVTGFGRCARTLALTLKSMGARADIFARSSKALAEANALGFDAFHLDEMCRRLNKYDIIFNSVPFGIFDSECASSFKNGCIFIDIASAPGGISEDACIKNSDYNFLPGLPGKYSPHSAAEIIEKVIMKVICESGKDATNGF